MSRITAAEKELTGEPTPVKGGPTAQAQKHAGEPVTPEMLHDITEGEVRVRRDWARADSRSEYLPSRQDRIEVDFTDLDTRLASLRWFGQG